LLDPTAVGLLTALLGTTMSSAAHLVGALCMPIADAAVDLLAGALPGSAPAEPSDEATWLRVTTYVQRHLREPDLTPEAMAAAGLVSLRSLYALFAARGDTPARYVRRRRLEAAHRELVRRGTAVSVAQVAHAWGFGDQATFSRAFRSAYGRTPDDVRRSSPDVRGFGSRAPTRETPAR
jgi:AraC-like DNA-binding protein